jgi:hypothetical protein
MGSDRELLQEILWRLRRIEEHLGIPEESPIGDRKGPPVERHDGPITGVEPSKKENHSARPLPLFRTT